MTQKIISIIPAKGRSKAMYINSLRKNKITVRQFYKEVEDLTRHVHVADSIGTMGEGLQIGEGMINFKEFLPKLIKSNVFYLPEIWLGYNYGGRGFIHALNEITDIVMNS